VFAWVGGVEAEVFSSVDLARFVAYLRVTRYEVTVSTFVP
jgi:hypothetical protein